MLKTELKIFKVIFEGKYFEDRLHQQLKSPSLVVMVNLKVSTLVHKMLKMSLIRHAVSTFSSTKPNKSLKTHTKNILATW